VKTRAVGANYHLEYAGFHYSVPYTLHGEKVLLHATAKTIEVLDKNRVHQALHLRQYTAGKGRYITKEEHMPLNHRAMRKQGHFDGERYRKWAKNIGIDMYWDIEAILINYKAEQQSCKSCMGILQSAKHYGSERLEMAYSRTRKIGSPTYQTVMRYFKQTVKNAPEPPSSAPKPYHDNLCGSAYYRLGEMMMLSNQTDHCTHAMRLPAMTAEYLRQRETPVMDALGFDECVGLMVDAEWRAWKNNRIQRLLRGANLRVKSACFAVIDYRPTRRFEQETIARLSDFV
jgi:hypothetical protein